MLQKSTKEPQNSPEYLQQRIQPYTILKKKDITRTLNLEKIAGVTISNTSQEFVIHGIKGEHDIRYRSNIREFLLKYLIISYTQQCNRRLKIYVTNKDLLRDYCTQEDESKQNLTKIPTWESLEVDSYQNINIFFANALLKSPMYQKVLYIQDPEIFKVWLTDFETGLILGSGSYGNIYLVKQKTKYFSESGERLDEQQLQQSQSKQNSGISSIFNVTGMFDSQSGSNSNQNNNNKDQFSIEPKERYALKKINISDLGERDPEDFQNMIIEHKEQDHPFAVKLKFAFRKNDDFYIMTELMQGGDLYKQINMNQYIAESNARFYFIEGALAINSFHENGMVYKDLKPENILIDATGHTYLSSYGFTYTEQNSSQSKQKESNIIATINYTSPEVLRGNSHSFASDYWSLGVLLYEICTGIPPFYHENEDLVIHLIKENKVIFPEYSQQKLSKDCQELILGLLNSDESKRFNLEQIKKHPWVKNLNWQGFENRTASPPFKPKLKEDSTITGKYFDYQLINRQDIV